MDDRQVGDREQPTVWAGKTPLKHSTVGRESPVAEQPCLHPLSPIF